MATPTVHPLARYVRHIAAAAAPLPDAHLLERFAAGSDGDAFAILVRRHGPMVLAVCRRVLRDWHTAEDAFQATFLVLARKASALRKPHSLSPWLHGVAYRTALKARACAARRRICERQAGAQRPEAQAPVDRSGPDLRPALDEAIGLLPERYRAPIVLCYLQGRTVDQAARELGWPRGTVATRLARARERLRTQLTRRGLVLSAAVPATLACSTATAAMQFMDVAATSSGSVPAYVVSLTREVLQAMTICKMRKMAFTVLAAGLVGLGLFALAYRPETASGNPGSGAAADPQAKLNGPPPIDGEKARELKLPPGPMPTQALVSLDSDGKLLTRLAMTRYVPVKAVDEAGQVRTAYQGVTEVLEHRHDVKDVQGYNSHGEPIDARALAKMLGKEKLVLVYMNGQTLDPLHLRLVKDGTLVLVLPAPVAVPPLADGVLPPRPVVPPVQALPPQPVENADPILPPRRQ